jgi:hypothetical protein
MYSSKGGARWREKAVHFVKFNCVQQKLDLEPDRTNIPVYCLPKHVTGQKKAAEIQGSFAIFVCECAKSCIEKEDPVCIRDSRHLVGHRILFGVDAGNPCRSSALS